ncbi:MAG: DUF1614 domain-containing protein [Firmicutes bacterium]|nr:DUF1614 domain-containing protein [Bacillota bacterium]
MIPLPLSAVLLGLITAALYFGFGQRILDRMRLRGSTAFLILILMIGGHFLPTLALGPRLGLNLGAVIPLGVVIYLLATTSARERKKAALISTLTAFLVLLTDKALPPDPGFLDPVFSGGLFAGILAYLGDRSRRGAFIAGILGILLADLIVLLEISAGDIPQQFIIGSGGVFSGLVISPFLAVILAEGIGEIRERIKRSALKQGGNEND